MRCVQAYVCNAVGSIRQCLPGEEIMHALVIYSTLWHTCNINFMLLFCFRNVSLSYLLENLLKNSWLDFSRIQ